MDTGDQLFSTILSLFFGALLLIVLLRFARLPNLLGYFILGIFVGPHGVGILEDIGPTHAVAEFGVMALMFTLGLEFSVSKLFGMRHHVFFLGGLQVLICMAVAMAIASFLGYSFSSSFLIATVCAMSSTAIISKLLMETNQVATPHGSRIVSVLLLQDLAVILMLILLPGLAVMDDSLLLQVGITALQALLMMLIVLYFGPWLMRRWLAWISRQGSNELFIFNILFILMGLSWITHSVGLSLVLGAFLAGILISETPQRYQVSDLISPFRDLFLGFFFVTIGALLDLDQLLENWLLILTIASCFIIAKTAIVFAVCRLETSHLGTCFKASIALGGASEFGFVFITAAHAINLIDDELFQILLPVNLVAMLHTLFLWPHTSFLVKKFLSKPSSSPDDTEDVDAPGDHVVICGFGRTAKQVANVLDGEGVEYCAVEANHDLFVRAAKEGKNVVYGNAEHSWTLQSARIKNARAVLITYPDLASSIRIIGEIRRINPQVPIIAKSADSAGVKMLEESGANEVVSEIQESSSMMAVLLLANLGVPLSEVQKKGISLVSERHQIFREFSSNVPKNPENSHRVCAVIITEQSACLGKFVAQILPKEEDGGVKLIAFRRKGKALPVNDKLRLHSGDQLSLLGTPQALDYTERLLLQGEDAVKGESPKPEAA